MTSARQRLLSTPGRILLAVTSILGAMAFFWPFLITATGTANSAHRHDAPILLLVIAPLLLILLAVEVSKGRLDARGIAVLGILAACGTALRIPSPGVAGLEPLFFLLVLAGRVYGPGFGFALGGLTLMVSALATGGVGPWLPFQMLAAGWVGAGAGLLPAGTGRPERWVLAAYTAIACVLYGTVMNLWFWPFGAGGSTSVSYVSAAGLGVNLRHFLAFDLATSLGFDLPRAFLNAALILLVGAPVLIALRRAATRTRLGPNVERRSKVTEAR